MSDLALLEQEDGVARLTLNRPDARNALSLDLLQALGARLDELASSSDAHVCVLTGAGRAFCAGMDLKVVLDDPGAPKKLLDAIADVTLKLRALPMVVVGRVNRAAIGGGCGLMCVCDIAITHADAKVGYPEVDLGVCPAVVAPWLIRRIGAGRARRVLLAGGTMSGEQALAEGMVDGLAPSLEGLDEEVQGVVERLAGAGPQAVCATKSWLNELDGSSDAEAVRRGAAISAEVLGTPEARASLERAFGRG